MTDERFVYESDIRSKKNIAHQAIHRKNGSKSKKCTLPNDGISQKQWKEMNGPVQTVNLNAPIAWKDFKTLSSQMQETYVMNLIRKYNISQGDFAELLGISGPTISTYFKSRNIKFRKGRKFRSKKQEDDWIAFVCDIPETEVANNETYVKPTPCEVSLVFRGKLKLDDIFSSLKETFGNTVDGCIRVTFEKEGA